MTSRRLFQLAYAGPRATGCGIIAAAQAIIIERGVMPALVEVAPTSPSRSAVLPAEVVKATPKPPDLGQRQRGF
jgi:hypothetical protein